MLKMRILGEKAVESPQLWGIRPQILGELGDPPPNFGPSATRGSAPRPTLCYFRLLL